MRTFNSLPVAIALALTTMAPASNADDRGFFIAPNVPVLVFDGDIDLNADAGAGLGLGGVFGDYAVEIMWDQISTEIDNTNIATDVTWYSLDGLYHFNGATQSSPYVRLGLGNIEYESDTGSADESMWKAGLGYQHWFDKAFSLRLEALAIKGLDSGEGYLNAGIQLALSYYFGTEGDGKAPSRPVADTDGDGVSDNVDRCPSTPSNATVDSFGCVKVRAKDSDGDGIADADDQCPNTPAGTAVDGQGCAKDADKDGVMDSVDKCPNSPQGAKVDDSGCEQKLKEAVSITMQVEFDSGSANLRTSSNDEIKKVANFLIQYPSTQAVIEGHTDSMGNNKFNLSLSKQRAEAVVNALITQYGIDASRLKSVGYGENQPIADNETAAGRQKNRRVVATIKATR